MLHLACILAFKSASLEPVRDTILTEVDSDGIYEQVCLDGPAMWQRGQHLIAAEPKKPSVPP